MLGCAKSTSEEPVAPNNTEQHTDNTSEEQLELEQEETSEDTIQSLEQISAKDGNIFLDALKQQDTSLLSRLMAHAENEYTETDMASVLEGFLLYFDDLEGLKLNFEANEQNDEFYIERYNIVGTKADEARSLPFQVSYAKSQGIELIMDDNKREPHYNSPLIGQYPYAVLDAERYVQALQTQDKESLALHLGLYDDNEQTKEAIDQLLQTYNESFSLSSVEIVSKGYNDQEKLFLFELKDSNQKTHEFHIVTDEFKVVDDWVAGQTKD